MDFAHSVNQEEFVDSEFVKEFFLPGNITDEQQIGFVIVYNTVNFCYWGEPKWTVKIGNAFYDGGIGLLLALKNAVLEKTDLLNASYLKNLPAENLRKILLGNTEIPLFRERLVLLRALGKGVAEKYKCSFSDIIKKANGEATKIVKLLAKDFPEIFNDTAFYHGTEVKFYKRAQLVPSQLFDLKKCNKISIHISGYDKLTAFADYKIPQVMRKMGILKYSDTLANKIDNKMEIPSGSDEEIEIRASTIWAIQMTVEILKVKFPNINAAKIDNLLWSRGQTKSTLDKPYHRTRTIWY